MQLVGHVPYNLAPRISLFSVETRDVNKALAKVIGEKVNLYQLLLVYNCVTVLSISIIILY